jgi:hypothetical protein
MLILLPLSVALRILVLCQLSGINLISISFDYSQCRQYSFSFTCSTGRGGVRASHGARGGESQTNRMCMQVSVSMSALSVFVLSAFVCFFTALKVQFIRRHPAFKNVVQVLAR